jgi:hypothetical protein
VSSWGGAEPLTSEFKLRGGKGGVRGAEKLDVGKGRGKKNEDENEDEKRTGTFTFGFPPDPTWLEAAFMASV